VNFFFTLLLQLYNGLKGAIPRSDVLTGTVNLMDIVRSVSRLRAESVKIKPHFAASVPFAFRVM
jgi:hypothetical protein